ncbi:Protease inhibitor bitisilin-1 [Trichinella patagoniensis]|uniref:Protease inhibitor bitisilin-1 n=1 Tax=Trichinella patagoniensis TaxID=990121 RepID=A0A0V0ZRM5_9BILA|nr:Protease inhibitor bitisilin-1 [Trichinella patagoniensis]
MFHEQFNSSMIFLVCQTDKYTIIISPQLCSLSIDQGTCSNPETRYAYDRQARRCVSFTYNGCGGNLNNFSTMEDCIQVCSKQSIRQSATTSSSKDEESEN